MCLRSRAQTPCLCLVPYDRASRADCYTEPSELDMPPFPGALGARIVGAIMTSARFLAEQRRFDDEVRGLEHVEFLGGTGGQPRSNLGEPLERFSEAACRARDACVLPHDGANRVGRH